MAVKVPRKTKKQRVNRKTGFEDPNFEGCERWSGEKFHRYVDKFKWLYYNQADIKDVVPAIYHWMKENDYSKADIAAAKRAKHISPQVAILCRLMNLGMPSFHKAEAEYWTALPGTGNTMAPRDEYVRRELAKAIEDGTARKEEAEAVEKANAKIYKPSIREVMFEASCAMTEEIEDFIEEFMRTRDAKSVKGFNPLAVLQKNQAKANHARMIRKLYEAEQHEMQIVNNQPKPSELKKMTEAEQDEWAQIKEAYGELPKDYLKASLELYTKIVDACDILIAEQKVERKPRKAKEKTLDQQVSKLKFKASDAEYGIASEPPTKLIGAVCAVVFNTKNRKLGIYVANDSSGFKVKGTTLVDYNEKTSLQKTIRKPLEVLPGYKKTTKAKTLKQFEFLKTTETKLNGRFNDDTVILAVYK